ncbi:MAG: glycosyltransferase family 39 protein [Magnetococcales bacterium]|nr:glycosyltransferase family 39 protein [Magnetococcales bacterium]
MTSESQTLPFATLRRIFLVALLVRLLFLAFSATDLEWLTLSDSKKYLRIADAILVDGDWHNPARLPLYPMFLSLFFQWLPDFFVPPLIGQALMDSVTCLLIALLGREVSEKLFLPAAWLAVLNLNMIGHASIILTDTLFLLLFSWHLLMAVRYLKVPTWGRAIALGIALGLSLLTRPVMMYFLPVVILLFLFVLVVRRTAWHSALMQGVVCLGLAMALISPVLIHNKQTYGVASLSSQSGGTVLIWYVPLTMNYVDGVPWESGVSQMKEKARQRRLEQGYEEVPENPFTWSRIQIETAKEAFQNLGVWKMVYGWSVGGGINIMSPSISSLPAVIGMERPRFYTTEGSHFGTKIWNFLTHPDNRLYLALMIPAILLTLLLRLLALMGAIAWLRGRGFDRWSLWYLVPAFGYILAVTGPVVNASRYRLPLEPTLIVMTAIGVLVVQEWYIRRRERGQTR